MIAVLDYGAGNIGSVLNMLKKLGSEGIATTGPAELFSAEKIILPGVGSFDTAMRRLNENGLAEALRGRAEAGVPLFGICLGMQLLASRSEEGDLPGLGLIPGIVKRFRFSNGVANLKVPHMGWNTVRVKKSSTLAADLGAAPRFYFVHSYHLECEQKNDELLEAEYGYPFTAGVQRGNIAGVQFHPEKSHRFGMQILKNFVLS